MARVIFRRIAGRLVPIKIAGHGFEKGGKFREFAARHGETGEKLGSMMTYAAKGKKSKTTAFVQNVHVDPQHRHQGISTALFKYASDVLSRAGYKFLRSIDVKSPAQVKIRSKLKSKFLVEEIDYSKLEAVVKPASPEKAMKAAVSNEVSTWVRATTMLKKGKKSTR